ncbi:hypothetical protein IJ674_05725 [bacterium]|nr:hypothetical protein [bacterium]
MCMSFVPELRIMLTKEVNDWIKKVEKGNYSSWDIMEEFAQFSKYLTKTEMKQITKRLRANEKH